MKIDVLDTKYTIERDSNDPVFACNSADMLALGYCSDDWIVTMFPKLLAAFQKAKCI